MKPLQAWEREDIVTAELEAFRIQATFVASLGFSASTLNPKL